MKNHTGRSPETAATAPGVLRKTCAMCGAPITPAEWNLCPACAKPSVTETPRRIPPHEVREHFLSSPFARAMAALDVLDVAFEGNRIVVLSEHDRNMRWQITLLREDGSFVKSSHSNCRLTLNAWWIGFTGRRLRVIVGQDPLGLPEGREYPRL